MGNKNTIILALGANLENPKEMLYKAIGKIKEIESIDFICSSSIYLTQPQGGPENQNWYHNCVILIDSKLSPLEILNKMLNIEQKLGRIRTIKDGPRIIDIDLIIYNDLIINNNKKLVIPHPRMQNRRFVLEPLAEILPNWLHPIFKKTSKELLEVINQDEQKIKKLDIELKN